MDQTVSFPMEQASFRAYGTWTAFRQALNRCGCDGLEGIWVGEAFPADLPRDLMIGYHLTFYPDWLDFYRDDRPALTEKFGSPEIAAAFYGGHGREGLLEQYRLDLERAAAMQVKYVVFHVSDVSLEECYTYRWLHTHEEVIDAAVELINTLLKGQDWPFEFLVENQWWPGFTFTDPKLTARLLEGIAYPRTGIMLDTGHLMNACTALRTQAEGAAYIQQMLDLHGSLAKAVRGVHLHQSLSGDYVRAHTGSLPEGLPKDYFQRFSVSYSHILNIDLHQPWTDPAICPVLERLDPAYLTHEMTARTIAQRMEAVRIQAETLKRGGRG